jgi:hypothetical protein
VGGPAVGGPVVGGPAVGTTSSASSAAGPTAAAARPGATPAAPTAGTAALPLPEFTGEPEHAEGRAPDGAGDSEDERARRAHVPSWDDILLGVRRRH